MNTVSDVVRVALGEVGYREKATNAFLDLREANQGTGNWTKYARDLWQAGYYNGNKNGYAWCDVFVDWVFFQVFGKTEGQILECQSGDLGAACPYSAGYYRARGRYDHAPRVGDQVFFQQNGKLVHTGIVVEVTGIHIGTVEGNSSNQVKKNTYALSDPRIAGYGHPLYKETDSRKENSPPVPAGPDQGQVTVSLPALRTGSTGAPVKTIQRILFARGIRDDRNRPLFVDGVYGPGTREAVVKAQKQLFPQAPNRWDGVVGQETWTALLTALW